MKRSQVGWAERTSRASEEEPEEDLEGQEGMSCLLYTSDAANE